MAQEAPFGSPAKIVSADALLSTLVPASTDAPSEPISPASNLFNRPSTQAGQQQSEPRKGAQCWSTDQTNAFSVLRWLLSKAIVQCALLQSDHVQSLQGGASV
ncbi:MAG: hypothetical protein Q9196_000613 [Gyalolechia fulgens]